MCIRDRFEAVQKAHEAGDLDLVAELETQIWFDGMGRTSAQVDQAMRGLAYTCLLYTSRCV